VFDIYKTLLNTIAEPIASHDLELLSKVATMLKGTDGESWAAGESLERMLRYIAMSVAFAKESKPHAHGVLHKPRQDEVCSCVWCGNQQSLRMIPHRQSDNALVGWVFACKDCVPIVYGGNVNIEYTKGEDIQR